LDEGIYPFPCLAYCCIENNAFIRIYFYFLATEAKTVPNKKAINALEGRHKLRYTQASLSDSAARSVLKKRAFYDL